jgi:hypothetical protein
MYKGTNEITNKGLGFKLINFMSFGEYPQNIQGGPRCQRKSWNSTTGATWEDPRRLQEALHLSTPRGATMWGRSAPPPGHP